VEISIAGPEDTHGIRAVQYRSWLANTASEESGRSFDGANKMRSTSSRYGMSKLKNDVRCSRNNSLPGSETVVAKVNQKVVGFCTVVRGSEQNSLAEIYYSRIPTEEDRPEALGFSASIYRSEQ